MTSRTKPADANDADSGADPSLRQGPAQALAQALAAELTRVVEAYRRMPHSKFGLRLEPHGDRAQAGYWLATQFTLLAQGMENWDSPKAPRWRELPVLGAFALGDQIAVVGNDLLAAFQALKDPREALVWTPGGGRVPAEKAMAAMLDSTTALRKAL
ncbi:MAG: hypothetical protein JF587_03535 [Catenulisporales bacterium]|nr:hypothetical protein [Catenulisporales bacterium]